MSSSKRITQLEREFTTKLLESLNDASSHLNELKQRNPTYENVSIDSSKMKQELEKQKRDVSRKFTKMETEEKSSKVFLDHEFDSRLHFLSFQGKCFDRTTNEKYEVCFFDKAKQGHTNIGKWGHFDEVDKNVLYFTDGLVCATGKARETKVKFICGSEDKIVEITEPAVCQYEITFESPFGCMGIIPQEFLEFNK